MVYGNREHLIGVSVQRVVALDAGLDCCRRALHVDIPVVIVEFEVSASFCNASSSTFELAEAHAASLCLSIEYHGVQTGNLDPILVLYGRDRLFNIGRCDLSRHIRFAHLVNESLSEV